MIINLICGDNIFTTNDRQWNKIRGIISCAVQEFILDYKNNMINYDLQPFNTNINKRTNANMNETIENGNDYPEINHFTNSLYEKTLNKDQLLNSINDLLNNIKNNNYYINPQKNKNVKDSSFVKLYKEYIDIFTILGVAGICSLNTDNLNYGFYSIGNAYDIANTIDMVLPFINNEYIEHLIFEVMLFFNQSIKNNLIITITDKIVPNNLDNLDDFDYLNNLDYLNDLNDSINCNSSNNNNKIKIPLIKNIHKKGSLSEKLYTKCKKQSKLHTFPHLKCQNCGHFLNNIKYDTDFII